MNNIKYHLIGALTSKPYAFTARSWELKSVETIDLFDSLGSNIRIDIRGSEIMRILPVNNEFINEEWISDKTRFAYDGLKRKRFITPMIKKNNLFVQTSWKEAFSFIENKWNTEHFNNLVINTGNFTDLETTTILKEFSSKFDNVIVNHDKNQNNDLQNNYLLDKELFTVTGNKIYILAGVNLKIENPVLNIKLKRLSQSNNVLIAYIGPKIVNTLNAVHLGNNIDVLKSIIAGKHPFSVQIKNFLKKNSKNTKITAQLRNSISIILGNDFEKLENNVNYLNSLNQVKLNNLTFDVNVLTLTPGTINKKEINLYKQGVLDNGKKNFFYLVNTEDCNSIKAGDFVVFQGNHNEKLHNSFDVILPNITWVEKSSLYLNCLGYIQKTQFVTLPPVQARNDWKITKMLSIFLKKPLTVSNITDVHNRLNEISPAILTNLSKYTKLNNQKLSLLKDKLFNTKYIYNNMPLNSVLSNYYQTDSISKASKVMDTCTKTLAINKNNFNKY